MHSHRHVAASLVPALLASLLAACGQSDPTPPPALASFTATPALLPFGGGQVVLAWTASNASARGHDLHADGEQCRGHRYRHSGREGGSIANAALLDL